ncbi:response regulator [Chromobacterium sp. IIBBL 290-4]|uniref:response regulator n=1 Tax=Chromobacterium sp. IIBBL 290-4 TaxID=2953890 RepID=UPI0020B6E7B9|nr:response regulator [Chromobacterium sp. IIBBL 290-4]UTH74164.1 response regulator [Chromobacterium sp. IIBBL 290-4]
MTMEQAATILLVEDNPLNRSLLEQMLEWLELKADQAEDGQQAVEMALHADYRLILMDVQMPVMNGLEATYQIRHSDLKRQPRIVAMTANAFVEDKQRCLEAGMDGMLVKPFRLDDLRHVLDSCLMDDEPQAGEGPARAE